MPVLDNGQVIAIVSRANLVQALASARKRDFELDSSDRVLRQAILDAVSGTPVAGRPFNVLVHDGKVELWGCVYSSEEQQALRVAAEATPGITWVEDNLRLLPAVIGL